MIGKSFFIKSLMQASFILLAQPLCAQSPLYSFFYNIDPAEAKLIGRLPTQSQNLLEQESFFSQIKKNEIQHHRNSLKRAATEFVDPDGLFKDFGIALGALLVKFSKKKSAKKHQKAEDKNPHKLCPNSLRQISSKKGPTQKKKSKKRKILARIGSGFGWSLLSVNSLWLLRDAQKAYQDKDFDSEEDWMAKRAQERNGRLIDPQLYPEDALYLETLEDIWLTQLSDELSAFLEKNKTSDISFAASIPEWKASDLFEAVPSQGLIILWNNSVSTDKKMLVLKVRPENFGWKISAAMSTELLDEPLQNSFFSNLQTKNDNVQIKEPSLFWKSFRSQSPQLAFESFLSLE